MQAIILAAGMGKRLGELTQNITKCMIRVDGVTLIERMLSQLDKLKLERIIVVIGFKGENLVEFIETLKINTPIIFVENADYYKTNNIYSLYLTKSFLSEKDTILLESDIIFEDCVLQKLIDNSNPNCALVDKYESWMDGTVVTIDDNDNIERFISVKDFKYDDIPHYYKTVNIYKFNIEFLNKYYIPFLEAYSIALGKNEYYEQVLKVITLLETNEIKAFRLQGEKWYEIDDVQDLDIAESVFAKTEEKRLLKTQQRYGGYWRFPKLLDFCYLVNPYFPNNRLKNEMKANFDTILCQYPSGMKVNSLLAAKYFGIEPEYTVVGNGASELIKAFIEKYTKNLGVIYPTFEEYPNRKDNSSLTIFKPDNDNFSYSVNDIISFFENKFITDLLLINPDNPSGNFISKQDICLLIEWTRKKQIQLIIDESFIDFAENSIDQSVLNNSILKSASHLVVIKSISKSYGVPGLRLGILASSNKELILNLKNEVSIWNINSFAEFYMQIFSKYEKIYISSCSEFRLERERFYSELKTISYLRIIPSQANYFLCEVVNSYTSKELTNLLFKEFNILIKDCSNKFGLIEKQYIRIAIRNKADNTILINALKKYIINDEGK